MKEWVQNVIRFKLKHPLDLIPKPPKPKKPRRKLSSTNMARLKLEHRFGFNWHKLAFSPQSMTKYCLECPLAECINCLDSLKTRNFPPPSSEDEE